MSRTDKNIEKHVKVQWGAWWPLVTYFFLTIAIAAVVFFLDQDHFGIRSRNPSVRQVDGVTSSSAPFILLQSDVTSLLSLLLTVLRFVGMLSIGTITWRCVYFLMGNEQGIPLRDIQWIIRFGLPKRSQNTFRVAAILLIAFPSQFSSPILTGSITWSPSTYLIQGIQANKQIPLATNGTAWMMYRRAPSIVNVVAQQAAGLAGIAWGNAKNSTSKSMVRVLPSIHSLQNGGELANITVPYFAIENVEWVEDPRVHLTPAQIKSAFDTTTSDTFTQRTGEGPLFAFVPDSRWGPPMDNFTFPPSRIIAETRLVRIIVDFLTNRDPCGHASSYFGRIPPNIGLYQENYRDGTLCLAFARVTYRAGAALCDQCRSTNRFVFTNTTILEVREDVMTREALDLMFIVSQFMVFGNFTLPSPINNIDNFVAEGLSRSYQASWSSLHQKLGLSAALSTNVKVSVPASQAYVKKWRIGVWALINIMFTLSGFICFIAIQDPVIIDISIASMLMETDNTIRDHPQFLGDLSVVTEKDRNLRLHLQYIDGHRTLTIIDPPSDPGRGHYQQLH